MVEALFVGAVAGLGGRAGDHAAQAYARLAESYRGRAYHNLRHIEAVLETFLFIAEGLSTEAESIVTLALCYHDVVYDSQAKDNEERSAEFADHELEGLGISPEDRAEVRRLILLTQRHDVSPGDVLGAIVVDADLAILQSPTAEYDRYAAAIREEYSWVPEADYQAGRTKVLQSLMAKKLFTSSLLDEDLARANMSREIATLSDSSR